MDVVAPTAVRRLFDGQAAIDGCLDRENCLRAIVLHGLAMGMDAEPAEIDVLAAVEEDSDVVDEVDVAAEWSPECDATGGLRLWTSLLVGRSEANAVQAFDAVIAKDRAEAEARLRARYGIALTDDLRVVEGFDPALPLVEALVSPALADMLKQVADDPASPLAHGLSVSVQQRFAT